MSLKALIFDLDDTLVIEYESVETVFRETCWLAAAKHGIDPNALYKTIRETCRELWYDGPARQYGLRIGISSWEGLWARFEGDDPNLAVLREWAPKYRHASWQKSLAKHGVNDPAFADELDAAFQDKRRYLHVVFDDVFPALDAFKKSYRLALLTNGASDLQREKIAGARLGPYFDEIVISGDVGFGKPDPRIFNITTARLGVPPANTWMIGNSLNSDIKGAHAAGMKAVWLNRSHQPRDESIIPDFEIANLAKLQLFLPFA